MVAKQNNTVKMPRGISLSCKVISCDELLVVVFTLVFSTFSAATLEAAEDLRVAGLFWSMSNKNL